MVHITVKKLEIHIPVIFSTNWERDESQTTSLSCRLKICHNGHIRTGFPLLIKDAIVQQVLDEQMRETVHRLSL